MAKLPLLEATFVIMMEMNQKLTVYMQLRREMHRSVRIFKYEISHRELIQT
jgi:hypothetical protein